VRAFRNGSVRAWTPCLVGRTKGIITTQRGGRKRSRGGGGGGGGGGGHQRARGSEVGSTRPSPRELGLMAGGRAEREVGRERSMNDHGKGGRGLPRGYRRSRAGALVAETNFLRKWHLKPERRRGLMPLPQLDRNQDWRCSDKLPGYTNARWEGNGPAKKSLHRTQG